MQGESSLGVFDAAHFATGRDIQQSGLKADGDDLAWAKVKADEQGVSKNDVPQPGNAQNRESRIERHLV